MKFQLVVGIMAMLALAGSANAGKGPKGDKRSHHGRKGGEGSRHGKGGSGPRECKAFNDHNATIVEAVVSACATCNQTLAGPANATEKLSHEERKAFRDSCTKLKNDCNECISNVSHMDI